MCLQNRWLGRIELNMSAVPRPGFRAREASNFLSATVTDAHVRIRDMMCEDVALDVSCHIFTGNVWEESSATWANSNPNSYVSTALSTRTLSWSIGDTFSSKHWYTFDVTDAVQGWINKNYTQSKGIIFKVASSIENGSAIKNRTFGSYNRSSYRPSLTVTYYEPVSAIAVSPTSATINVGQTVALTAIISPTSAEKQTVEWSSSNVLVASVSATGVVTGVSSGQASITCRSNDSGVAAICNITVNPTSYLSMAVDEFYSTTMTRGQYFWYSFTPSEAGYYTFYSSGAQNVDLRGYVYYGSTQMYEDDDGGENRHFKIRCRLTKGITYYLKVEGYYTSTTGSFSVSVCKSWPEAVEPTILSRSEWGAHDIVESRLEPRTREPQRIIYHHSADSFSDTDIIATKHEILRIQETHMGAGEKCDIAYHFIIDPAGRIWQGAEIDNYQRGHASGFYDDIGVLVLGDFESRFENLWNPDTLNDAQKNAMILIAKWLCYEYDIPVEIANGPITTHRQVCDTLCPGEEMAPWVEDNLLNTILNWRK